MKKGMVWILTLGLILGLAGCAEDGEEKDVAGDKSGAVVIRFWHMDDSGVRKDTIEQIISNFNEEYAGKIKVEALGINFWDYWDKISVSMAAMEEPDVFLNDLGSVGARAETGALRNLDELLAGAGMDPDKLFFQAPLAMCRFDGALYSLPYETDVRLLYYNKDMFAEAGLDPEKAPSSWEEVQEIGRKLAVKYENGDYDRMGLNILLPHSYFLTYVWGTGAGFVNAEGEIQVNSSEVINALVEWKGMIDEYGHERLVKFNSEFGVGGAADPFIVEKLGMTIGVPDFYSQVKKYNSDLNFGYAQVPYPAGPASWSNGFSLELSARSEHQDEAFLFMSYLMSTKVQKLKAQMSSALITNVEAATDPELMADPFWKETVATLDNTHFRPISIKAPMWSEHLNKGVDEVVYGKKTPREAMDHAQEMIDNDIKKYEMTH